MRLSLLFTAAILLIFAGGWGCGKKPKPAQPMADAGAPAAQGTNQAGSAAAPAASGNGKIAGKVTFTGTPPALETVKMDADPFCKSHATSSASETVVIAADGGLKNVLVYIKVGHKGKKIPPAQGDALIDQVGCRYIPHVMAVRVNQPVKIKNSDGTLHNVHGLGKANPEFNFGQPTQGMVNEKKFSAAEIAIKLKCDVHPWMGAYIAVLEHPWFAVTGDDGSFAIPDVPAGTYTVEAWHEAMPPQTSEVTVAGADAALNFTFQK